MVQRHHTGQLRRNRQQMLVPCFLMPRVLININVLRCFQHGKYAVRQFQSQVTGPGYFSISSGKMETTDVFFFSPAFTNTASHGRAGYRREQVRPWLFKISNGSGEPQTVSGIAGEMLDGLFRYPSLIPVCMFLLFNPTILLIASSTCTPRFDPSSSCHSSTVITCRFSNRASWFLQPATNAGFQA